MKNAVRNFSYLTTSPITVEGWLHLGSVDSNLSASDAARLCEIHGYNALLVRDQSAHVGLFLPEYLREMLPQTTIAKDVLAPLALVTRDLGVWIDAIDDANLDFHAELVNQGLQLRKCPTGHVTSANPCTTHHMTTQPFP